MPLTLKDLDVGDTFRYAERVVGSTNIMVKTMPSHVLNVEMGTAIHLNMGGSYALGAMRGEALERVLVKVAEAPPAPDEFSGGIRYHHFLDAKTGAIRATLVTEPVNDYVLAALAVRNPKDHGSRAEGRRWALKKLRESQGVVVFSPEELKATIRDRSILHYFAVGSKIDLSTIRPRAPFVGTAKRMFEPGWFTTVAGQ